MPEITATYGSITVAGKNFKDRKSIFDISFPTRSMIWTYAPGFAAIMETYHEHQRSAYSCAEADALGLLLSRLAGQPNVDHGNIEFSIATSDSGKELWQPCKNCAKWLNEGTGFGRDRKFRLNNVALTAIRG